ncbi:carbohydrate ABC transporter permease [Phytohabitans sp. ZYX-F-186]|uniref:Carbohydrate ABC transporter permease n=1 Tax=Phytohabitans maris TaxID=3071409 RepID=A0ABU0Z9B8_9ACTN|nr:carbohydrate ABC transporter permease [Phytohabitans sp. ZYX-F-186]MDQ7903634.1 carbohydrate ABC transporter permease [Phytohabitans sp. ZYX-F-186]
MNRSLRRRGTAVAVHIGLLALVAWALAPLAVMLATSVKPSGEIFQIPPRLLPSRPTLDHYTRVLTESDLPRTMVNSVLVALLVTVVTLIVGGSAGYALARLRYRGSRAVAVLILAGQLLPVTVLLLPLYRLVSSLGMLDTIAGLALVHLTTVLPLVVWMTRNAFAAVPVELEEAAQVDGCTRVEAVAATVLPVAAPGLAAVAIFAFLESWNEFVLASVITLTNQSKTAPIGLTDFANNVTTDWGATTAAATVLTVPIAVLFLLVQRHFVSGLASGAVKG